MCVFVCERGRVCVCVCVCVLAGLLPVKSGLIFLSKQEFNIYLRAFRSVSILWNSKGLSVRLPILVRDKSEVAAY